MLRRLPLILGALAAAAALLLLGPVAVAVLLLRSSPAAQGASLGAFILIALIVLAVASLAGFAAWALARLVERLLRRRGEAAPPAETARRS